MKPPALWVALWAVLSASAAGAVLVPLPGDPASAEVAQEPVRLQDSVRLTRLTGGALPADGLTAVGLGVRTCGAVDLRAGQLERIGRREYFLLAETSPFAWLAVWAEVPWRSWEAGRSGAPAAGSGLGDGLWQAALRAPIPSARWHLALTGGGNLPLGDQAAGLGEGVLSPRLGAALTLRLMTGGKTPEMRLHLNAAQVWNRAEDTGYGMGRAGYQPAPPRYPAADQVGGPDGNDAVLLGGAVEIRRGTTSLWLEYSQERFASAAYAAPGEQPRAVGAGLRWGVVEGLAIRGNYLVNLTRDDAATEWYPAYPDWTMSVAVSRQFSIGGRDRDGDGIVDRKDHCPNVPEDRDGFADDDGCPDRDNDGDGVPDFRDAAPDRPEDFDGFEDDDGQPEYDNDQDGIADRDDLCPDEPEDMDGHQDDDGCPDDFLDRDADGVEDRLDACPDQPEDRDGFEDADGCPELDNDLDGIPDLQDACPDSPEDYNGEADEDGCPETG